MSALEDAVAAVLRLDGLLAETRSAAGEAQAVVEAALGLAEAIGLSRQAAELGAVLDDLDSAAGQVERVRGRVEVVLRTFEELGAGAGSVARAEGRRPAPVVGLTSPTRRPDSTAEPSGIPESVPRASARNQRDVHLQNQAARALANAGYQVELPPRGSSVSPDFKIDGLIADCYAPRAATTVDGVGNKLFKKIRREQAFRFVINLEDSPITPRELREHLARKHSSRLREVLVVKGDHVERVYP